MTTINNECHFQCMRSSEITYGNKIYLSKIEHSGSCPTPRYQNFTVQLPTTFEQLGVRLEHPREGMTLTLSNFVPEYDIVSPFQVTDGTIAFSTILSGNLSDQYYDGDIRKIDIVGPCDLNVALNHCEGEATIKAGCPMRSVSIYLEKDLLMSLIEDAGQYENILNAMDKKAGVSLLDELTMSPETQIIAKQILDCPYDNPFRKIFLESKALELIAMTLQRLDKKTKKRAISLSSSDIDRLHEAQRVLFKQMIEPPSIKKLSTLVGINEFKLKKGFRELFGCTVYQALRSHRMEFARNLLLDTNMTVGEAASMVGYTNMSHFISAFRNQFGVTPGSLLSHSRRRVLS